MKLYIFFVFIVIAITTSCSPKITTKVDKSYPILNYDQKVIVIEKDQPVPKNSEVLGTITIGDSGFSTKCEYNLIIDKAKLEARKVGGNAIKITEHKTPDIVSNCHRIKAQILRVNDFSDIQEKKTNIIIR